MIYDIRQTTDCTYASSVAHAHHVLRLTPINRPGQRVQVSSLRIEPEPVHWREGQDFFGNRLTWIAIEEAHEALTVKMSARIAVEKFAVPAVADTPSWEAVQEEVFASTAIGPTAPSHFLFPSRMVSLDPEIRDYARPSFPPGRSLFEGARELMRRIKTDMVYDTAATTVTTTPPMSFALRRGVCQDFAHIMISGLRGLGLSAAYVSGYLRTNRPPGATRLQGADATHAWVLVWCGAAIGWVGFDPTNDLIASDEHIVLAVGRDYTDVAPMDGVIVAHGGQHIDVSVNVIPVG
ncbi:MAG: transglutaminase family protein [Rhodopseudomonas sp.]|nr:transglutaminase family protein [Rhodopseudomonas sp.]